MNTKELYDQVTAEVVRQIEAGAADWRMPWQAIADADQPMNASTHKGYRGGNHLHLAMVGLGRGWSGHWATYKQWSALGAQVRKGERGTYGAKWGEVIDRKTGEKRLVPFTFTVFAAEQVDGWEAPAATPRDTPERIADADAFFAAIGANVRHEGNRAYYAPAADAITLPAIDQFDTAHDYYATSTHEHAHWTGHASRLDRSLGNRFGSDAYAAEELVAELSAAFTCGHLRISSTPRPDHASYLASWLRVLKADSSALFHVATKAQAATDHLIIVSAEVATVARELVTA